jgi:hypothetical protein
VGLVSNKVTDAALKAKLANVDETDPNSILHRIVGRTLTVTPGELSSIARDHELLQVHLPASKYGDYKTADLSNQDWYIPERLVTKAGGTEWINIDLFQTTPWSYGSKAHSMIYPTEGSDDPDPNSDVNEKYSPKDPKDLWDSDAVARAAVADAAPETTGAPADSTSKYTFYKIDKKSGTDLDACIDEAQGKELDKLSGSIDGL